MAIRRTTDEAGVLENGDDQGDSKENSTALATAGESLTFTVSLPVHVHEMPDDELAVSIDEVAISPAYPAGGATTTTVTLVADEVAIMPVVPEDEAPAIPALPDWDDVYTRRGRQRGEISTSPEPAGMLTAERLINSGYRRGRRPAPEGRLQKLLYSITLRLVNIGDSYRIRERKSIDQRIGKSLEGGTRYVAVLTRKGGVGKTTISALLGMAMAEVREDRILAVDANPDRGTLAERVVKNTRATVRDVVTRAASISTFTEFQTLISRDGTRLDVLASDADPTVSEAFDDNDYNVVADMAERFYSIVVTDCGTGMLHSAMRATLQRVDSIVVVSGGGVDEARLASETLTWLESNGFPELVKGAVVALNTSTQGTNLVKLEEIEAHFQSRVRETVRIPYDPSLATGSIIRFDDIKPITRAAARELAAVVIDGLDERQAS